MKYTFLTFILCSVNLVYSQGIISDIMRVETVSIDLSEVNEKLLSKYKETHKKETANMVSDLAKIDQKYQDEVSTFIEDFTNKLKDGEEKIVSSMKDITISRVTSLTMTHKRDKKNRVQDFLNKMQIANRKLPLFLREDYSITVNETGSKHFESFTKDYAAHIETITAFEEHEHLIVTEGNPDPVN